MVVVKKQKGESDDKLIARFRKKIIDSGIIVDFRERDRYKKKSQKRKEQMYRVRYLREVEKKRNTM